MFGEFWSFHSLIYTIDRYFILFLSSRLTQAGHWLGMGSKLVLLHGDNLRNKERSVIQDFQVFTHAFPPIWLGLHNNYKLEKRRCVKSSCMICYSAINDWFFFFCSKINHLPICKIVRASQAWDISINRFHQIVCNNELHSKMEYDKFNVCPPFFFISMLLL